MRALLVCLFAIGCSAEVAEEPAPASYSVRWVERAGGKCGPVPDTTARAGSPQLPADTCNIETDGTVCDIEGRTLTGSMECSSPLKTCVFTAGAVYGCASVYDLTFTPQ